MAPQSNNTTTRAGEEQTLRGLIMKYGEVPTHIIIPKIQRDYAQGRKGKESVRKNFLDDLFEVICSSKSQPRIYDYIYGQLEKPNPEHPDYYCFYPVDGQQRLTTMFLLHLYIGKRAGKDVDFLKCFSYQTRNSSTLFCEMLCDIDPKEFNNVVDYIKNSYRFTSHWENDPTISSMLRMLGDIESRFVANGAQCTHQYFEQCWDNLVKNVRFWMLDLSDLKTTDDIYIKMNSRGKSLTSFEIFKSELDNLVVNKRTGFVDGEITKEIDTNWTDLFWDYREKKRDFTETDLNNPGALDYTDNGLDDKMLNFFRNYLTLEGLKNGVLPNSKMAARMAAIELADLVVSKSPDVFLNIKKILDFFCNIKKNGTDVSKWFERFLTSTTEEKRFVTAPTSLEVKVNSNPLPNKNATTDYLAVFMEPLVTHTDKLFSEGLFYLILHKPMTFKEIDGQNPDLDNLRILRNLIVNSEIHDDESDYHKNSMAGNFNAVDLLMSKGIQSLVGFKSEFSGAQISQEIDKWSWLSRVGTAEQVAMKQLENHSVLRGNLKVLSGTTPLSLDKINNFRRLFKNGALYDEIEQIALSFGDYAVVNNDSKNYAVKKLEGWRDRIFVNSNNDSTATFENMLNCGPKIYADYVSDKDSFIKNCKTNRQFPWTYYLCLYGSMRWAPKGWYLKAGHSYLHYMFNASTCIHSDTYIHYNVYNDAVYCKMGEALVSEDDRGGALTIRHTGATIDILEDTIAIQLRDGSRYHVAIPQINGFDEVDRVEWGQSIVNKLICLSKARHDEATRQSADQSQDHNEMKKLLSSDLDGADWPWLIKDSNPTIEEIIPNDVIDDETEMA